MDETKKPLQKVNNKNWFANRYSVYLQILQINYIIIQFISGLTLPVVSDISIPPA